nr:hypothetical protein [Tanacetum cinerariifolium]
MAETMEQYMRKTRADYGSRIASPKIEDKDSFGLKGQFLKELRDNTFSGSDHEDANEHIEKVLEIMNLFHIPNITIDQVMLRAFPMSLTEAASHWLKTNHLEVVLFYNGLDVPTRQILDSRGAIPSKTVFDAKVAIQEMDEYSQKWHNGTSRPRSTKTFNGLAAIQAQLNNLGREIKKVNEKFYAAQVGCEQCKGPHYTKDCPLKEEGKTLEEAYYTQFGTPFQGGGYRATAPGFYQRNNANPSYQERRQSMKDTLRKFMSASVSVMPLSTYLYLGLGKLAHIKLTVKLADRTVKYPKGIAENVLVELRRDQVDDLMATIEEGKVVEELRARNDARMREVGINKRRFDRMITIHNGNEKVTYQMVRSHPRFKHHTKEQCNKFPAITNGKKGRYDEWNLALIQKAQEFLQGGLELRTRICPGSKDGRMAHTRAHKRV